MKRFETLALVVLYGALKAKGVPARLVYYGDEGHWIETKDNALHWWSEFLGWLDGLKPEAEATPKATAAMKAEFDQFTAAANRFADEAISDEQLLAMVQGMGEDG